MDQNSFLEVAPPDSPTRKDALSFYAWILDSSIKLPGGFRIGLDGLIGLIPVVGDVLATFLSGGIVIHAFRNGVSLPVLLRMLGNIVLELVIGSIPVIGDLFDFAFRANERNVRLIQAFNEKPSITRRRSLGVVSLVAASLLLLLVLVATILWQLMSLLLTAMG